MERIYHRQQLGDMEALYTEEAGRIGLTIYPAACRTKVRERAQLPVDSLFQFKLVGDASGKGYINGHSMHNSASLDNLCVTSWAVHETEQAGGLDICTQARTARGCTAEHHLICQQGTEALTSWQVFTNNSDAPVKLELLTSFSVSGLSPFHEKNVPESIYVHRLRSKWSMEGFHERYLLEEHQIEPCWKPSGASVERFGQRGSMPVRGFFPVVAVEDSLEQVFWAFALGQPYSWQLELFRKQDDLCVSGGLADRDFGHWQKTLQPGESFRTPDAWLTTSKGSFDHVMQRLASVQKAALAEHLLPREEELPVQFNEFCATWGHPSEAYVETLLALVRQHDIDYFVIDAGWHADPDGSWENNMGTWQLNRDLFPHGMQYTAQAIERAGLLPGIWFEAEVVGKDSTYFNMPEHLLQKDGIPVTSGPRRFWDMRQPWVKAHLQKRIINFLKENGVRYIKIDYNDNIGTGIDHPDSLGEGLRKQMEAAQDFFREIRRQLPEIVIENCASGGHRLVNSWMGITDVSSFSDAHEAVSIPIIAANLHWVMQPRQELIWAVLRGGDDKKRLWYSLAATFLGRMCLSGDVEKLSAEQWAVVDEAIAFYRDIVPCIRAGESRRFGDGVLNYNQPRGAQGVLRCADDGKSAVLVLHAFRNASSEILNVELPEGVWDIAGSFGDTDIVLRQAAGNCMQAAFKGDFTARAICLKRRE